MKPELALLGVRPGALPLPASQQQPLQCRFLGSHRIENVLKKNACGGGVWDRGGKEPREGAGSCQVPQTDTLVQSLGRGLGMHLRVVAARGMGVGVFVSQFPGTSGPSCK